MYRGRDIFYKYKNVIITVAKVFQLLPLGFRKKFLSLFRNKKGRTGIALRYILLKGIARSVGNNVAIYRGVYLYSIENLDIGSHVSIHPMCYIDATGGITIGNSVSIAHGTTIMPTSHCYDNPDIPIKDQGTVKKPAMVEDDVWIGTKATILCGVTIASGSIIGANTLINKNVPVKAVVGGVLGRLLKARLTIRSQ